MPARGVKSPVAASKQEALVREILEGVADRMDGFVVEALEGKGEVRFCRLRERIDDVSQKMLTKTLRRLERDGLLTRRVHATARRRQADAARREPGTLRLQRVDVGGGTHAGCGTSGRVYDTSTTLPSNSPPNRTSKGYR
jgi:DNA-binding transcriptional ArsR family regulator